MTTHSIDHHLASMRIVRELMPALGEPLPEAFWDTLPLDIDDDNASLQLHHKLRFYRKLLDANQDPLFGLRFSALFPAQAFGAFGFAIQSAQDLRTQLKIMSDYFELSYTVQIVSYRPSNDGGALEARCAEANIDADIKRFFADRDLATIHKILSHATSGYGRPARVQLEHEGGALAHAFEEFFNCPVEFGSGANRLIFREEDLERLNPYRHPAAFDMCVRECEQLRTRLIKAEDMSERVRRELYRRPGYLQDVGSVARRLGVSSRTLRRRLEEERQSFQQLQQQVRYEQAREHLANGALSVSDIAEILGYSEIGNFTNAFKRWSGGVSPQGFRKRKCALDQGGSPIARWASADIHK